MTWADQEGETGGLDPPEKSQTIGFLSNIGLDPLKNHIATKPAFNVGPSSAPSEAPFKWSFAGGRVMALS